MGWVKQGAGWRTSKFSFWMMLSCGVVACGGAQPPHARMSSAEAAVQSAETGGAGELPKGKLHLKYARDQIVEARRLIEDKDYEEADLTLQRAEVDAQYALALARQKEAQEESEEVLEEISELMEKAKQ